MFNSSFYKIGMISLLFIPAICIPYLKVEYKKRDLRLLKLNMPEPVYGNEMYYNYSTLDKVRKVAILKELNWNDPNLDKAIYEFSGLDSNQAFLEKIPVNYQYGIRIKLSNQTTYETLVKLINICQKYEIDRYAFDLRYNELYIYDIFNRPKGEEIALERFSWDCLEIEDPETTFFQKIMEDFRNYITPVVKSFDKTLFIYMGFLAIVFVAYRKGK